MRENLPEGTLAWIEDKSEAIEEEGGDSGEEKGMTNSIVPK